MSRLSDAFPRGRTGLVCYAMGGDPTLAATEELLRAIDGEGADVIEIGLPFSDPIADGPTLQAAATRALRGGATLGRLLEIVERLKLRAPVVAMKLALVAQEDRECTAGARLSRSSSCLQFASAHSPWWNCSWSLASSPSSSRFSCRP